MESEYKRFKCITRRQIEFLVTFMEKNPELVVGHISEEFPLHKKKRMWEDLKKELNSVDPSNSKTVDRWKKTWVDKKCNVRNKAMLYKKNMKNNEREKGPRFTLLEKRILKLIGLKQLSQVCPTAESRINLPLLETEDSYNDLLKDSSSKMSFSGSLLPTLTECQIKELMEIDSKQPLINGTFEFEPVSSKDTENLENSQLSLFGVPTETKESVSMPENILEQQIVVKEEPPDDFTYETSSFSTLEPPNPIIVSVAPVITTVQPCAPIVNMAVPGSTKGSDPQSPIVGSLAPSPSTEDLQSGNLTNTNHSGESQVVEPDSESQITSTEKPQTEDDEDTRVYLHLGRRKINNAGKKSAAIKAADALTAMAERNCLVLERIARAIEIQAVQSAKQTQLMDRLIDILSKK